MAVRVKHILIGILMSILPIISADSKALNATPTQEDAYLAYAEVMPQIQGGLASIMKTISYPTMAAKIGVEGVVYVMAFINENGSVEDAKVIKGIGAGCDEAAVDAVKKAKFTPAQNSGQVVKVKMSLPIKFKLSK